MKVVVMPGFSELIIKANPTGEVTREGMLNLNMPWLYAPWPEAKQKGIIKMEVAGDTLKALLIELGHRYQQAGVDFIPFNNEINQVDLDYDVIVNGKSFLSLPVGVDTVLKEDDEVKVKVMWRWDG